MNRVVREEAGRDLVLRGTAPLKPHFEFEFCSVAPYFMVHITTSFVWIGDDLDKSWPYLRLAVVVAAARLIFTHTRRAREPVPGVPSSATSARAAGVWVALLAVLRGRPAGQPASQSVS